MTTTTRKQWVSQAGPRQTKKVDEAISSLQWKGQSHVEITDHGRRVLTVMSMCGGGTDCSTEAYDAIGEKHDWSITRENHKDIISDIEAATENLILPEVDKRTTRGERDEREEKSRIHQLHIEEQAETKATERDKHVEELRTLYPWAVDSSGGMSDHARASKNLKKELQITFPGIRFSVRSDSFSMGNSIDIGWTDGPTTKQVESISKKYEYGRFDCMTDMSSSDNSAYGQAVEIVLGRSKFVQSQRKLTDGLNEEIGQLLCQVHTITYDGPRTRHLYGKSDERDIQDHAYQLMSRTRFPIGYKVKGLVKDGIVAEYKIEFEESATPTLNSPSDSTAGIEKHFHTKRQVDFWLVVLTDRVERTEFETLRTQCQSAGGWYSRKWGKTPGGFAFDSEEKAESFRETLGGYPESVETSKPVTTDKFVKMAERLESEAADKLAPRATHTAKKLCQARSAERDGAEFQRAASYARAIDSTGKFQHMTKKRLIEIAHQTGTNVANGYHSYSVESGEFYDKSEEAAAIRRLADELLTEADKQETASQTKEIERKRAEDELRNSQHAGFYPTPDPLIEEMIDLADIGDDSEVLEPSAGKGDIIRSIQKRHPSAVINWCEIAPTLADFIRQYCGPISGVELSDSDFLANRHRYWFDRIVMNPPFEKSQALEHVKHAWGFLANSGRLVSVFPTGSQLDKLREWIDTNEIDHDIHDVEENAFKGLDSFRQTGISCVLVVLNN